jgi:sensor histidine kinase YesM
MRLTTLLRSALRSEGEFTTLGHELDLIECYLEIERERFEERLQTRIEIAPGLRHHSIPALIVQPLVENAIKHGIAVARDGGWVVVSADLADEGGFLEVIVRNTGAPLGAGSSAAGSGIGLQNVANRLRCYYGDEATLHLSSNARGETVAEVRIPSHRVVSDDDVPALVQQTRS